MACDPAFRSLSATPARFGRQSSSASRWRVSPRRKPRCTSCRALLLKATSGYPFPLLPVAAWIATLTLAQFATNWWTRNRVFIVLGNMTVAPGQHSVLGLSPHRRGDPGLDWPPNRWPMIFDFPLSAYALMAVIGLASFGATVAGVARQRRGDSPAAIPWTAGSAGYPDWVRNLLRFPCPRRPRRGRRCGST